jgi:hypothetical protein
MAPVLAIVWMVAGVVLDGPTPLGRLSSFRQPGRTMLNSPWRGQHETQPKRENGRKSGPARQQKMFVGTSNFSRIGVFR